ncbi:hypothetical protein FDJ32_gp03 [Pseudomonas phage NV1]|uniref:Uncharacterized protein n=1 Tax=Pseudomonas phage NV1 TaxID=2079543 RepID=A0A2L0HPL1_9CAUD|nr:hypothetical protein FDJ32_gp03 [Pseudomonas phage NV1]AUX83632.1 hypothetical protein NV1_p03 [Pseudomonas phage NV1]
MQLCTTSKPCCARHKRKAHCLLTNVSAYCWACLPRRLRRKQPNQPPRVGPCDTVTGPSTGSIEVHPMYTAFGGIYPEDHHGPGSLFRDGVHYKFLFRDGQVHCGVWDLRQTHGGYQYTVRVA